MLITLAIRHVTDLNNEGTYFPAVVETPDRSTPGISNAIVRDHNLNCPLRMVRWRGPIYPRWSDNDQRDSWRTSKESATPTRCRWRQERNSRRALGISRAISQIDSKSFWYRSAVERNRNSTISLSLKVARCKCARIAGCKRITPWPELY